MPKTYICKSKFHVCYNILSIYENPRRKNFINPPVPNILKKLMEIKNDIIFIFTLLCGASERFHLNSAQISSDFSTWIPDYDSHSPPLLDFFLFSDPRIWYTMALPPLGNTDHVVFSVSIDFLSNSKRDTTFHHIAYAYSQAVWDGLCDHLRDVPWEEIFKINASAAVEVGSVWN